MPSSPAPAQERLRPRENSAEAATLSEQPEVLAKQLQHGAEQAAREQITLPAEARLRAIQNLDGDPAHAEDVAASYAARAERLRTDLQTSLDALSAPELTATPVDALVQPEITPPELIENKPQAADLDIAMPAAASVEQHKPTELEVEQGRFNAWLIKLVDVLRDGTLPDSFRHFIDAKPNAEQYKNAADELQVIYKTYLADPRIPADKVQPFTVQIQDLAYSSTQALLATRAAEIKNPLPEGAAGDDDDVDGAAQTAKVDDTAKQEVAYDKFAERNAASQAYIQQLKSPDLSVTNQSMEPIVQLARQLLDQHPEAVVRFDTVGNLVLGQPEADGSGLSHRLLTLNIHAHEAILEWLHRSLPHETLTLRDNRYTITVIEDPKLQSEYLAEAA